MGVSDYVTNIATLFKNVVLNAVGVQRTFYELIEDKDIPRAISMMQDHDVDVDNALDEYYPQKHKVMQRPNKERKNLPTYITCKLPRALQKSINETELFFLLSNPIVWKKEDGDDEVFQMFTEFLAESRFNSTMRKVKRIAGSETESAKLYHIYKEKSGDKEEVRIKPVVLARSTGYQLRPLFDQYGDMMAFAYGYKVKTGKGNSVQHWDIQTPEMIFECSNEGIGWNVKPRPNPTGRINVLYYHQEKAWAGVEPRIERIEDLDSKIGDTNNYFADPIAFATGDVIELMKDPEASGKMIKGTGPNSRFEYINPPQSSELRASEKKELHDTVLLDTFTPDIDVEKMRALGVMSGVAIKRALTIGYIKRGNLLETYEEMVDREKNIIIECLKVKYPEKATKLAKLKVSFTFSEPFDEDKEKTWSSICQLYGAGLVSLETAVGMLSLTKAPEEEIDKIRMAATEKMMAEQELKEEQAQEQNPAQTEEEEE